jgi:ribonuclease Z
MEILFFGTSSGVPTRNRNVSGVGFKPTPRREWWLFDCGEGTQHRVQHSNYLLADLSKIFITHMHGDHVLGLPGLLSSAGMGGRRDRLDVYGPPELGEFIEHSLRLTQSYLPYPVNVHDVSEGFSWENDHLIVSSERLKHRIPAYGYRVAEKHSTGRFLVEKAQEMGIPAGPIYTRLKRGETVTLDDGRTIDGRELCDGLRPGRIFAYCTDTTYCEAAVRLGRHADVLVHECTFLNADEARAIEATHSTAGMAGRVAREAEARRLIVTHFSARYSEEGDPAFLQLLDEARAEFPRTDAARELTPYAITGRMKDEG